MMTFETYLIAVSAIFGASVSAAVRQYSDGLISQAAMYDKSLTATGVFILMGVLPYLVCNYPKVVSAGMVIAAILAWL